MQDFLVYHSGTYGTPSGTSSVLIEIVDVVNLKLPTEMFGSFGADDGVYPAYHMNKQHWISVLLPDAPEDVVRFLTNVSYIATETGCKKK